MTLAITEDRAISEGPLDAAQRAAYSRDGVLTDRGLFSAEEAAGLEFRPLLGRPGDACFFDSYVPPRSGPNTTACSRLQPGISGRPLRDSSCRQAPELPTADRAELPALEHGLLEMGFEMLLPPEQQSRILLAVREPQAPWYDFQRMHHELYAQGFTYPGKAGRTPCFRLSVLGDIDVSDIESFLAALRRHVKRRTATRSRQQ